MGQQVAQSDLGRARPRDRTTVGTETGQHLDRVEFRTDRRGGCIELQVPVLDQAHGGHTGDGLRHRLDRADGVDGHRLARPGGPFPFGSLVADTSGIDDDRDDTGNVSGVDRSPEDRVDLASHDGETRPFSRSGGTPTDSA